MTWPRILHWTLVVAVFAAVGLLAWWNRAELARAIGLIGRVSPWLMLAAVVAIAGVFVSRGCAYRIALRAMGYSFGRGFLARTALAATSAHHLIPTGGASGYAVITYAFHQRGVAAGRASMLALVDTLSNAVALASLVIGVLVYLAGAPATSGANLAIGLLPGVALVVLAAGLYYLQRDRQRLLGFARRVSAGAARLVGRRWPEEGVERFLDQYYDGKRLIAANPAGFLRMVGWQYAAVLCNCLALYAIFYALGVVPPPWVVFTGLILAMAGVAVVAAPAGAGSFEVVMSGYFVLHGIAAADSIAATLLYRVVSFWLPVLASVPVMVGLRHQRPLGSSEES